MKILFICGSLDPGRNGVGDYTRRLGCELIKQGHKVKAISIAERHLDHEIREVQSLGNRELQVLRLPSHWPKNKSLRHTKTCIGNFNPQWISLQFVPFSFHSKGLPFFLPSWLSKLDIEKAKWHLMFHELWVADVSTSSIKEWLLRELQKKIIKNLLNRFKEAWIDTSNQTYQGMLERYISMVGVLPIFSNLPKGHKMALPQISNRDKQIVAVFFGHLQENPKFIENIKLLKNAIVSQLSKELVIFHIGNNRNPKTAKLINQVSTQLEIQTIPLGFLDEQQAADVLFNADIGLSNYPVDLIHKSGSIASMLYNELPMILLNGDNSSSVISNLPEITQLNVELDIDLFIHQHKDFWRKYDPFLTAKNLEQKFAPN